MTNLQAALGLAQLEQLETFIATKKSNYLLYREEINQIPGLKVLEFRNDIRCNYWFYSVFADKPYPLNRDQLITYLSKKGIQSRPIWGLIPDQAPYHGSTCYEVFTAPSYIEHIVNIPCSTNLTVEDAKYVIKCIKEVVDE
jgi:perosamine synthetase